jgi:hypothetical protein
MVNNETKITVTKTPEESANLNKNSTIDAKDDKPFAVAPSGPDLALQEKL